MKVNERKVEENLNDNPENPKMFFAISQGDLESLKSAVKEGADPQVKFAGVTTIYMANALEYSSLVEYLVSITSQNDIAFEPKEVDLGGNQSELSSDSESM